MKNNQLSVLLITILTSTMLIAPSAQATKLKDLFKEAVEEQINGKAEPAPENVPATPAANTPVTASPPPVQTDTNALISNTATTPAGRH